MTKQTRKQNNMKRGTIELVLLLLLQKGQKYGYQLAQELEEYSDGEYELKEATMYLPHIISPDAKWIFDLQPGKSRCPPHACVL